MPLFHLEDDASLYERTQAYARTAPISVVRDLETIITGNGLGVPPEKPIPDCLSQGLITENLCHTLFDSLRSLPLKRYGLDIDPWEIRTKSPVLFAAFLLLGLLTIPALWDSKLHVDLYTHARHLAEKVLLCSPLSLDTLRALLLFAIWDLVPHEKERYIDSWLMSGMGLVHGMLTIDTTSSDDSNNPARQASIDVWNALCLTHMQFVVGTGRPPVFSRTLLGDHVSDPQNYAIGSCSQALAVQSQLYCILYDLVISKSPRNFTFGGGPIEQWRETNRELIEADSSLGLAFAYSSAQLIHCRHTLKTLTDPTSDPSDLSLRMEEIETLTEDLVGLSLDHSFEIMEIYLKCATTDGMVRPAFASLMCSTAAITVVEFKEKLKSPSENFMLMEQLRSCSWGNRRTDGVVDWAANVIKTSVTEGMGARGTIS
ncbi:hypothetical protein GQ53DRAFT_835658 [Thozetella sp. PMI_491]|nr:hypothetical protein GQ53DRAFT_835658 [Thozetella sp. PMI_491]